MRISVVVPAYNQRTNLGRMLASLAPQVEADPDCEAVIVDDGSRDDTLRWARQWATAHPRFRVLSKRNEGPGRARNFGVRHTGGDVVAFIDQDCLAQPGWLAAIRSAYETDRQLACLEGRTVTEDDKVTPVSHFVTNEGGGFWTCNVSYRRAAFDAVGGFDHDYVVYAEDTDIALRVQKRGLRVRYSPQMLVLHPVYPLQVRAAVRKLPFILHSELLLYAKHPDYYAAHREGGRPDRYFYYYFLLRHYISNLKLELPWLRRHPVVFLRYACRMTAERVYLLALFDWFVRQRQRTRAAR